MPGRNLKDLHKDTVNYLQIGNEASVSVGGSCGMQHWNRKGAECSLLDPWENVRARYRRGQLVKATITDVVESGALAQLEPGLKGWIDIGQMSHESAEGPGEVLSVGDDLLARIVEIDSDQHRIDLSLRTASQDIELCSVYEGVTMAVVEPEGVLDWLRDQLTGLWSWFGQLSQVLRR